MKRSKSRSSTNVSNKPADKQQTVSCVYFSWWCKFINFDNSSALDTHYPYIDDTNSIYELWPMSTILELKSMKFKRLKYGVTYGTVNNRSFYGKFDWKIMFHGFLICFSFFLSKILESVSCRKRNLNHESHILEKTLLYSNDVDVWALEIEIMKSNPNFQTKWNFVNIFDVTTEDRALAYNIVNDMIENRQQTFTNTFTYTETDTKI